MEKDYFESIGKAPIIKVKNIPKGANIFAKLELINPTGSIKDTMAAYMMKKAKERGELIKGMDILEVTSGNTGIAFAALSAMHGYKFTAVMPEGMSGERIKIMKAYGAKVVLTPKEQDMAGAIKKYETLAKKMKNAWLPKQFENPDNINAHKNITGKEILSKMKRVDAVVAGIGTGGTLIGVAQALKKIHQHAKIIGIEPEESAVLSGKKAGRHNIQGIGEGFIPKIVDNNLNEIDEIITIKTKDAEKMAALIAKKEGLLVGISSGANLLGAIKTSKKIGKDKHILTFFCDRGERYLSTKIFD